MNRSLTKCGAIAILTGLAWFAPATATATTSPDHSGSVGVVATGNLGCEISLDDDAALVAAAHEAEFVFVGVVDKRPDRKRNDGSSKKSSRSEPADRPGAAASNIAKSAIGWQHAVTVETNLDSIYQDDSSVTVTVTDAPGPQKPRLEKGARYLFLASSEGNRLMASTCQVINLPDGKAAFNAAVQHLTELLGQTTVAPQKPQLTLAEGATEDPPAWGRIAAPGGALALVGVLGLVLAIRLGRERH